MLRVKRHFRRFRLDREADVSDYEKILDDSLCTITMRETQVEKVKTFGDEGNLQEITEFTTYLIHWEEEVL